MTFDKNFSTYDKNAIVQKKAAANLAEYIKNDISLFLSSSITERSASPR